MADTKVFQCPACRLNYSDEAVAKQCEEFCKEYIACSLEITQLSLERTKPANKSA